MKIVASALLTVFVSAVPMVAQSMPTRDSSSTQAQVTVPIVPATPSAQVSPVPVVQAQTTPETMPSVPKEAGLEFEGFGTPNMGRITDTIFEGDCPGEKAGDIKARFYSTGTPPAAGRRVMIRNVSRGLSGDEAPFTDRSYSDGRTSESTSVQFGTRHGLRHFAVLEGQNNLEYVIKQGDSTILEQGAFAIQISRSERTRNRSAICKDEKYCSGSENTPLDQCENVRTRSRCYCPDAPGNTFIRR
jgi:hypothetical protein